MNMRMCMRKGGRNKQKLNQLRSATVGMPKELPDMYWSADEYKEEENNDDDKVEDEEEYDSDASLSESEQHIGDVGCSFAGANAHRSAHYTAKITNILQAHSDVNCKNALTLNKEMLCRLLEMKERLQLLLQRVKERYNLNEQRIARSMKRGPQGVGMRGAYLKGGIFYFKGNMFFKDQNCRNCPNNPDYDYRSKVEGEMFPMDFELRSRHVWSLVDKGSIVEAIKEQVVDYLSDRRLHNYSKALYRPINKQILVHTEKLVNLLKQVGEDFRIDWAQVSAHNVHYRHSPVSCEAMWKVYLHPALKRSAWSEEENKRLLDAVTEHNSQNWSAIAASVGKRSDYQCFVQYQTTVCFMQSDRWTKWNKDDDYRLVEVVEQNSINGVVNWSIVASNFPHKPKTTLQARYTDRLNPQISHAPFTPEEDLILFAAVEEYGTKFSCFPRTLFPNRSLTQLRTRYRNTLEQRSKLDPWSVKDDRKLMEFTAQHGTSVWLKCSQLLGNHSRTSCRTRFLTIKKFFEKNPNALIDDLPRKKVRLMDNTITPQNWIEKVSELRNNPNADFKPEKRRKHKRSPELNKQKRAQRKHKGESKAILQQCSAQGIAQLGQRAQMKSRKTPRKRALYKNRLRVNELKFYHFFKYAYNFRLGVDPCMLLPGTYSLNVVAGALDFQIRTDIAYATDSYFPAAVSRKCKTVLQRTRDVQSFPAGYQLPPSWPTSMGFRTLCIHSAQPQTPPLTTMPMHNAHMRIAIQDNSAVKRFRSRLRALFFQITLLSRLHPQNVGNSEFQFEKLPQAEAPATAIDSETQSDDQGVTEQTILPVKLKCKGPKKVKPASDLEQPSAGAVELFATSTFNEEYLALGQLNKVTNATRKRKRNCNRPTDEVSAHIQHKYPLYEQHAETEIDTKTGLQSPIIKTEYES